jgi:hypothetical protein
MTPRQPEYSRTVRAKAWWRSKRAQSAIATWWIAVYAILQAAAARCLDSAGPLCILQSVTPSEWVLLAGAFATALFAVWFGRDSVGSPAEKYIR